VLLIDCLLDLLRLCTWACTYARVCVGKSREAEEKRINKELANIRSKFKGQPSTVVVAQLREQSWFFTRKESRKLRVDKCNAWLNGCLWRLRWLCVSAEVRLSDCELQ